MNVCDARYRIGNYVPQAGGTSGGSGTWTITSTETSNVAQSIMYINAVDIQANHGSFTTLTLAGTDFSTDLSSLNTNTKFMTATTSPDTTTFSSALVAPSITLSGGVFTVTTANMTNLYIAEAATTAYTVRIGNNVSTSGGVAIGTVSIGNSNLACNVTIGSSTSKLATFTMNGSFTLASSMPLLGYTFLPSLTTSHLGYTSSTNVCSSATFSTGSLTHLTLPISLPLGVWVVTFYARLQLSNTNATASTLNYITFNILLGTTVMGTYAAEIPIVPATSATFTTVSGTCIISQTSSTASAVTVVGALGAAPTNIVVTGLASTNTTKLSGLSAVRIS